MVGIYKITSPSGKVYIGQSWKIRERFWRYNGGQSQRQCKLHNSFLKYGVNNHKFEVIHELPENIDQKTLDDYEIFYWKQCIDAGIETLNLREPGKGGKMSEETKQKRRDKGLKPALGKTWKLSEETKRKHSIAMMGNKNCLGLKWSEERRSAALERNSIRRAAKKAKRYEEFINNLIARNKARSKKIQSFINNQIKENNVY